MKKQLFQLLAAIAFLIVCFIPATADQVFIANLSSAQEVPTNASTGRGVCVVTLNAAETSINVNLSYSNLTSAANMGHIHGPAPVGVNTGIQINFAGIGGMSANIIINNQPITPTQVQQIRSGLAYVNIHTVNFAGGEIRGQLKVANLFGDYDGDGRTDIGVFRPSAGSFFILNSLNNSVTAQQWGQNGDESDAMGDYDGDGRSDIAVKRNAPPALNWYILLSATNTLRAVQWGASDGENSDDTQTGDYDGDGKADITVYRPGNSAYYVLRSTDGGLTAQQWGIPNDRPVEGDFDRDGKNDFAVVRDSGGVLTWYILQSSNGGFTAFQWGISGDRELEGTRPDFDADGRTDIGVYRPSNNTFYIRQSSNGALLAFQFGQMGDFGAATDADGDGKADYVAIREVSGSLIWYIWQSYTNTLRAVQWGISGDEPV